MPCHFSNVKTAGLYDRRNGDISAGEIERIGILTNRGVRSVFRPKLSLVALLLTMIFAISCADRESYRVQETRLGTLDAGTEIISPVFSRDSRHLAYRVRRGQKYCLVLDGQDGGLYDAVGIATFSQDGKRVAYAGEKGD